jgi:2-methylfumaryl-CoA hydratase
VLDKLEIPGRSDVGALRVRLVALKNRPARDFPYKKDEKYDESVVLDLDYTLALPR